MLRNILITTGFILLIGCVIYSIVSGNNRQSSMFVPINIGYFLLIITCFVCATFCKTETKNTRVRFLIYQVAAENELNFADLTDKIKTLYLGANDEANSVVRKELVMMIEEGSLELKDGLVLLN